MLRRSKDIFVRTGIKAEEKAAAEAAVAAAALKEALESVLEVGGLAKVHEMVADPNADEAVAAAARSLLASLPDNVSLPRSLPPSGLHSSQDAGGVVA